MQSFDDTLKNPQWLQARIDEGLRGTQIAQLLGCSPALVSKTMKSLGLQHPIKAKLADREWLQLVYIDENRNAAQVAKLVGCTTSAVLDALRRHGFVVKDNAEAQTVRASNHGSSAPRPRMQYRSTLHDPEWLRARVAEGLGLSEIGRLVQCSPASVGWALEKFGLEAKSRESTVETIDAQAYLPRKATRSSKQVFWHQARRITPQGPCVVCDRPGVDVNHKDRVPSNNDPDNLERLCRRCHRQQHAAEERRLIQWLLDHGGSFFQDIYLGARADLIAGKGLTEDDEPEPE